MDKIRDLGPYISLLTTVLGYMDTKEHTYLEFSNETNIYTGGILADSNTYVQHEKTDSFLATFEVRTKVLYENIGKAYNVGAMLPYMNYIPKTLKDIIKEGDEYNGKIKGFNRASIWKTNSN